MVSISARPPGWVMTRSLSIKIAAPPRTRSMARAQRSSIARRRVQVGAKTQSRTASGISSAKACSRLRSECTWPSDRKGDSSERPGMRAVVFNRCGHGPRRVCNCTTIDSRTGSMAGLVTWAKRWRKNAYTGRGAWAKGASGVSSPIDQTASLPSLAMGASTIRTSSRV